MDKKGDIHRLLFEIADISFAILVGLTVLYYVYTITNDTSFQAKLYSEDLSQLLSTMQTVPAHNITITYILPENFKFVQENSNFYILDEDITLQLKFVKKSNVEFNFERNNNFLILEKNEILS